MSAEVSYIVKPVHLQPLEPAVIRLPYSEVCCHLGVAGTDCEVVILPGLPSLGSSAVVQLRKEGRDFSFPILLSEAGVRHDATGYWGIVMVPAAPVTIRDDVLPDDDGLEDRRRKAERDDLRFSGPTLQIMRFPGEDEHEGS